MACFYAYGSSVSGTVLQMEEVSMSSILELLVRDRSVAYNASIIHCTVAASEASSRRTT